MNNKKIKQKISLQKNIGQSGGASRWRVCYQRGLPRLVYIGLERKKGKTEKGKRRPSINVQPAAVRRSRENGTCLD